MNLFLIVINPSKTATITLNSFLKSNENFKEVDIKIIDSIESFLSYSSLNQISVKDAMYRITSNDISREIELDILMRGVKSMHDSDLWLYQYKSKTILNQYRNVQMVPTRIVLSADKKYLDKLVDELGGYPIIIKAPKGSHGVGVIKVESHETLYSIIDFMLAQDIDVTLKKYIEADGHYRVIVLDNKVLSTIKYNKPDKDFRTNSGEPEVSSVKLSQEGINVALDAVSKQDLQTNFGGVDLIWSEKDQKFYVMEVNFPCFFPRNESVDNISISSAIIQYLLDK
jgi:glutathione synthase/RimK-type ligase-like ATP-grasp enzyme